MKSIWYSFSNPYCVDFASLSIMLLFSSYV